MLSFSVFKHWASLRHSRQFAVRILLCNLLSLSISAQTPSSPADARWREAGLPFMQRYTPFDYAGTEQVWHITQDRRGLMYFAHIGDILEYDGAVWRHIPVGESLPIARVEADTTGRIWVGAFQELGYLAPDSLGFLKLHSLRDYVPPQILKSEKYWSVALASQVAYFQSGNVLLRWNEKSRIMKVWHSVAGFGDMFALDDELYLRESGVGLLRVEGDSLRLLPGGDKFASIGISAILSRGGDLQEKRTDRQHKPLLIASFQRGLFSYDGTSFRSFKTEADAYLQENHLRCGTILPDGGYALGTLQGGLVIIGPQGELRLIITKADGLLDNSVYHTYPDAQGGLWLALNKGIMRLEYPSPFSLFDRPPALRSSVNRIVQHKGKLYATTTESVFTMEPSPKSGSPPVFRPLAGLKAQTGRLLSAGGRLLIGSNQGIDQLLNERERSPQSEVAKVAGTSTPGCFVQSRYDSTRLYVGLFDGLALLLQRSGRWQYAGRVPLINDTIEGALEEDEQTLWLTTRYGVILRVTAPSLEPEHLLDPSAVKIERFDIIDGLPQGWTQVFRYDEKVLFTTTKGLHRFSPETRTFSLDSSFAGLFADFTWRFTWGKVQFDERKRIWTSRAGVFGVATPAPDGRYTWNETPFLRLAGLGGIWTLWIDQNRQGAYWFGGTFGITRYDETIPKDYSAKYPALIRRVIVNGDSLIYGGSFADPASAIKTPVLAFENNTIRFEFAAPYYDNPSSNRYQFLLEGFEKGWSNWAGETFVDYRHLPEGRYRFRVRARNIYHNIGDEAVFALEILPPWYRTWWSYSLLGALVMALLYSFRRYEMNRQQHKHRAELESVAAEKLKELDKLKSDFFANISHEFRTPLTLILGPTEQLLEQNTNGESKKLTTIRRNAQRLLQLVDQLLDLSKLERGKLKMQAAPGDFVAYLKGLAMSFESLAERKGIELQFVAEPCESQSDRDSQGLSETYFDRDKIEKIFTNLLSNAFKFTASGGTVRVAVSLRSDCPLRTFPLNKNGHQIMHPHCQVCIREGDKKQPQLCAEVTITDTGQGIPSEQLPHIFDRFYQVDSSSHRVHGGSGIGLALVKDMVDLHHGSIVVNSKEGKGTAFTICLPLGKAHLQPDEILTTAVEPHTPVFRDYDQVDEFPEQTLNRAANNKPSASGSGELILLIEDNADVRAYIREQLQKEYTIMEAADGETGIAKAVEVVPDLIISDVMMPKKNGYEVCSTLKTDPRTSHIPIVLLTAKAREREKLTGFETGADAYVLKPFRQQELAVRVRNLIELRRKLRAKYSTATVIKPSEVEATSMDRDFLQRVIAIIEAGMAEEDFTTEALAGEVAMSVSQLNRKLNALIGQPAGKLIRSMRLQRAADLLAQKSGTVAEICYAVGFGEQANFSRAFKKQFGCSPSAYQKAHRE